MKIEYAVDAYMDLGPGGVVMVKRTVASEEEALSAVQDQKPGWPVQAYERQVSDWVPLGSLQGEKNPCPYTFSHTRDWCGYPTCRES